MDINHTPQLTDDEIVEGLRRLDNVITRDYFYGFCRIAWHIYDRRYELRYKVGMDFYTLAHEYYLALSTHDFRQLTDRRPGVSLKTWMVNGFRFVVLDRLKAYQKEFGKRNTPLSSEKGTLQFDLPDNNFKADFRDMVLEICHRVLRRDSKDSIILQMILIDGFQNKEVAAQLGLSAPAVSQRFHKLMEKEVKPYFHHYYASTMFDEIGMAPEQDVSYSIATPYKCNVMATDYSNRITPDRIERLQPGEVFVFGSNLQGLHGGGAAHMARLHFGAEMGNGNGPQGQSYAIPTMQGGVETIRPYTDKFIAYAQAHPEQTFLVTAIGCGIAGFDPEEIAPLFAKAKDVGNIYLPKRFWEVLVKDDDLIIEDDFFPF